MQQLITVLFSGVLFCLMSKDNEGPVAKSCNRSAFTLPFTETK